MAAANAVRARASNWQVGDVFRTPSTNGKVERKAVPKPQTGISCDWFQATMHSNLREAVLMRLISAFGAAETINDIPKEMRCYREGIQFANGARLFHSNRYKETCCLVMSGRAKPTEHFSLLTNLIDLGVRPTRLDLAFDDRRGLLSMDTVRDEVKAGNDVSRWNESSYFEKTSLGSGIHRGRSIQFGSKSSASYLVIYDKGLETDSAEEGDWVRLELRLSDLAAEKFSAEVLCHDESDGPVLDSDLPPEFVERFKRLAIHALKSRLSFRERTTASNVSRAKLRPWWESFLEYFDPLPKDVPNQECADYECGQSLADKNMRREFRTLEQAEEILTEIYEEHIRPFAPNPLDELLRNIPEYGEPAPECADEDIDEVALALVGLLPSYGTNVIPFPAPNGGALKETRRKLPHRSAEVISLVEWKLREYSGVG